MLHPLSVVIITKNEEKNIANAIKSAKFASEVLILDSGSEDKTCEISRKLGARVEYQSWLGFGRQKNQAISLAKNNWVMVLDADEVITPKLQLEILEKLKKPNCNGYLVPRVNNFFGKDIRFCGLYPDYSLRLFNKKFGKFNNLAVHESVILKGKKDYLRNNLRHLAYESVGQFIDKQKKYANLSKKKKNIMKAILSPIWVFFKIFFLRLGFLDGWRGFVIAYLYSKYTFWKYYR